MCRSRLLLLANILALPFLLWFATWRVCSLWFMYLGGNDGACRALVELVERLEYVNDTIADGERDKTVLIAVLSAREVADRDVAFDEDYLKLFDSSRRYPLAYIRILDAQLHGGGDNTKEYVYELYPIGEYMGSMRIRCGPDGKLADAVIDYDWR